MQRPVSLVINAADYCIPDKNTVSDEFDNERLKDALNNFLLMQSKEKQAIFIRRYFWSEDISEIASAVGASQAKVKTVLFRMRLSLRELLEKEELL